jgi:hypothetical protein
MTEERQKCFPVKVTVHKLAPILHRASIQVIFPNNVRCPGPHNTTIKDSGIVLNLYVFAAVANVLGGLLKVAIFE